MLYPIFRELYLLSCNPTFGRLARENAKEKPAEEAQPLAINRVVRAVGRVARGIIVEKKQGRKFT
jgi:hypothetical protein